MARKTNPIIDDAPKPRLSQETMRQAIKAFEFIRPYRWSFIGGLFLLFISSLVFMIFPELIGELVDIAQGTSDLDFSLQDLGLGLIGILLFQGIVSYVRVLLFANVSEKGTADVRKALYQKLISLPITFFEENKLGDLISRLTADVEKLHSAFSITLAEFLRQVIIIVVGIILLLVTAPKLSMVMLLTVPVVTLSAVVFGRYIRRLSKERQKQLAESNSLVGESIQNIQIVKAFVTELFEVERYFVTISDVVRISMKYARGRALFAAFIIMVMFGVLFFVLWQGAVLLSEEKMTAGGLMSFAIYTFIIAGSFASLANFAPELLGAMGATERIREILETESEIDLDADPDISPIKIDGNIQFKDVKFKYPTRPDVTVLKGINIDVKAGEKVALVGPSGVGKSTIIQLLLRFYNISSGDILVDGNSIYDVNLRDFRNNIALVPQEVILFGGTIRENILYGKGNATEEEVMEAAHRSNSWEFISSFPEGLETVIGERGVKLSGGQRQRVAIARAILKNPAILLLDEATSSLDSESEKVVQDALDKLMEGRTSIIIAHRLTTIREVDSIYVIDDGRVAEKGTHEELSQLNGKYSTLANMQFEM